MKGRRKEHWWGPATVSSPTLARPVSECSCGHAAYAMFETRLRISCNHSNFKIRRRVRQLPYFVHVNAVLTIWRSEVEILQQWDEEEKDLLTRQLFTKTWTFACNKFNNSQCSLEQRATSRITKYHTELQVKYPISIKAKNCHDVIIGYMYIIHTNVTGITMF